MTRSLFHPAGFGEDFWLCFGTLDGEGETRHRIIVVLPAMRVADKVLEESGLGGVLGGVVDGGEDCAGEVFEDGFLAGLATAEARKNTMWLIENPVLKLVIGDVSGVIVLFFGP